MSVLAKKNLNAHAYLWLQRGVEPLLQWRCEPPVVDEVKRNDGWVTLGQNQRERISAVRGKRCHSTR